MLVISLPNGLKMINVFLKIRWQEAGCRLEAVQQLWEGKGALYEEESSVSIQVY